MNTIIFGLAIWRISSLLVNESGPFEIFQRVREWAGIQHDEAGIKTIIPDNSFAQVLSCIWCSSLWIALFFSVFIFFLPTLSLQIATLLSLSTIAIIIESYINWSKK